MKLARFSVGPWESYGLVEGDRVRAIQGSIFGEHTVTDASYPLDQVRLLPPTVPTAYWAVGLNYAAHIAHQEEALDTERIQRDSSAFRPWQKGANCIIGPGENIVPARRVGLRALRGGTAHRHRQALPPGVVGGRPQLYPGLLHRQRR